MQRKFIQVTPLLSTENVTRYQMKILHTEIFLITNTVAERRECDVLPNAAVRREVGEMQIQFRVLRRFPLITPLIEVEQ